MAKDPSTVPTAMRLTLIATIMSAIRFFSVQRSRPSLRQRGLVMTADCMECTIDPLVGFDYRARSRSGDALSAGPE